MFTGIVEDVGTVLSAEHDPLGARLSIATAVLDAGLLAPGESIAIDGACLTVTERTPGAGPAGGRFTVYASAETLSRTTLGERAVGDRVNLERALEVGGRLGGHVVLGHVDATGTIESLRPDGESVRIRVAIPRALARYLVSKGSVAVDGVSLTVNDLDDRAEATVVGITLVPYTLAHTALASKKPGARVNIEADILAKHLERLAFSRGS